MAMKGYLTFLKAPRFQPENHKFSCPIKETCKWLLPLCRDVVSVFYSPSTFGRFISCYY